MPATVLLAHGIPSLPNTSACNSGNAQPHLKVWGESEVLLSALWPHQEAAVLGGHLRSEPLATGGPTLLSLSPSYRMQAEAKGRSDFLFYNIIKQHLILQMTPLMGSCPGHD